jgi:hypothetical protein
MEIEANNTIRNTLTAVAVLYVGAYLMLQQHTEWRSDYQFSSLLHRLCHEDLLSHETSNRYLYIFTALKQ